MPPNSSLEGENAISDKVMYPSAEVSMYQSANTGNDDITISEHSDAASDVISANKIRERQATHKIKKFKINEGASTSTNTDIDGFRTVDRKHSMKQRNLLKNEKHHFADEMDTTGSAEPNDPNVNSKNSTDPKNVENSQNMQIKEKPTKKGGKPPPFFIKPPNNWDNFILNLKLAAPSLLSSLQKNGELKLTINTTEEYRNVDKMLFDMKVHSRSYLLTEDKPFKVVVRGLPINTDETKIADALHQYGYTVTKVTQLSKGPKNNKTKMPLFYVQLQKVANVETIYDIDELMFTQVSIERYRGSRGVAQCHNCQQFNHSAAACRMPTRCVKCGLNHKSQTCENKALEKCFCCNCKQYGHPASYRNCPKFPQTKKGGKNSNSETIKTVQRTFMPKLAEPTRSFANVTNTERTEPARSDFESHTKSKSTTDNNMHPKFLDYIMILEKNYDRLLILQAFKNVLPNLKATPNELDQIYILYESVITLASGGSLSGPAFRSRP